MKTITTLMTAAILMAGAALAETKPAAPATTTAKAPVAATAKTTKTSKKVVKKTSPKKPAVHKAVTKPAAK